MQTGVVVLRLIGARLAISLPLLLTVSALVFVLAWFIPGDAALSIAGLDARPEQVEMLRKQLRLDQPLYAQYWRWLADVFEGDLGRSPLNGESVVSALNGRLAVTLSLVGVATVAATVAGVALGIVSSRGGRISQRVSDVISITGLAVPGFWLGLLLISLFSVRWGWFPTGGYTPLSESPTAWARSLVLPAAALSLHGVTLVAKQTREAMLDVSRRDFIRTLRANGIPEWSIVLKHQLRNAAVPVVTVSGLLFISSLGGAVVLEEVFGLPGMGRLAVTATGNHDIPMIQGVAVYFTLLVVGMNLISDILYGWINPKVRIR